MTLHGPKLRRANTGRVVGSIAFLAATLWCATVWAVWGILCYRQGYTQVRLIDLLLPTRWANYRAAVGNHHLEAAQQRFAAGDIKATITLATAGTKLAPGNTKGRLLLAEAVLVSGLEQRAGDVLLGGVPTLFSDPEYLQTVMGFLYARHRNRDLAQVADTILASANSGSRLVITAAEFAACAALRRFDFAEANRIVYAHQLQDTPTGALIRSQILWEQGHRALAIQQLRNAVWTFPGFNPLALQLAEYLERQGDWVSLRNVLIELLARDPLAFPIRIRLLELEARRTRFDRLHADGVGYLEMFGSNVDALLALADFAANCGQANLARRIHEHARATSLPETPFWLMHAESLLNAGRPAAALALLQSGADRREQSAGASLPLEALLVLCHFETNDDSAARLHLARLLSSRNPPLGTLLKVARHLTELRRYSEAHNVLVRADQLSPRHPDVLAALVSLALASDRHGDLAAGVSRLLDTGNYHPDVVQAAAAELGRDRHLFDAEAGRVLARLASLRPSAPVPISNLASRQ